MSDQLIVWKLIKSSNIFFEQAHRIGPYTVKSDKLLNKYNQLIKCCLNCYFKILRKFDSTLDLKTKATLYYKVSQLLFTETISLDIAFDYCNKGIQICKINESQLIILKWKLQFLSFQIQYKLNNNANSKKSVLLYLNNLINEIPNYDDNNSNNNFFSIKIFFKFIKFKYFGMTFNAAQKNLTLKNLLNELGLNLNEKNLAFYNLLKLFQIQQLLLNNSSINSIMEHYRELKNINLKFSTEIKNLDLPIQLHAIEILLNILISIQNDSFNESKANIKVIDNFIKNIKASNLGWSNKLLISLPLDGNLNATFPIEFKWLSFKEFCSLSYFYCGISYIIKSWDGKNRSEKLFKFVENFNNNPLSLSSYNETEVSFLKLNYFKLLLNVYQILDEFNKNNYNETLFLKYPLILQFIRNYDTSKFSSQELIIYHNLIPLIFYLFAVINQKNGNFKNSIFYYLKIKKLVSFNNELSPNFFFNDLIKISFLQDSMGISSNLFKSIGIDNQLYYLSTLNLIVLIEGFLGDFNSTNKDLSEFNVDYTKKMDILKNFLNFKNFLILELNSVNKNNFNTNNLLNYTLSILKKTFNNHNDEFKNTDTINSINKIDKIDNIVNNDYVNNIDNLNNIDIENNINNMDIEKIDAESINEKNIQSPMLLSMIYYIKGKNFKKNVYENDLININSNLKFFSISYSYALQLNNNDDDNYNSKNMLAYLSSFEIYSIMNNNKNYFKTNQINEVLKSLRIFNHERKNENNNENNRENIKRSNDVDDYPASSKKKCIDK